MMTVGELRRALAALPVSAKDWPVRTVVTVAGDATTGYSDVATESEILEVTHRHAASGDPKTAVYLVLDV